MTPEGRSHDFPWFPPPNLLQPTAPGLAGLREVEIRTPPGAVDETEPTTRIVPGLPGLPRGSVGVEMMYGIAIKTWGLMKEM